MAGKGPFALDLQSGVCPEACKMHDRMLKIDMFPLLIIMLVNLVLVITASLRANSGETFRYPFSLRFLR